MKFIRNRDSFNTVLQYDDVLGPIKELPASDVGVSQILELANYIKLNDKYFGLIASSEGPCLFVQKDKFPLNNIDIKVFHRRGEESHHFKMERKGVIVIDEIYPRWQDLDIDPWSDEDFIDFFIFITNAARNPEFIQMWTI